MEPQTPPPGEKRTLTWPLALNLGLLVIIAILSGGSLDVVFSSVFGLVVINGLAALIVHLSGARMHYALAFLLSCLLLLLIGLGICGILIASN